MEYSIDPEYALEQDKKDPLRAFRHRFVIPKQSDGREACYFAGNSLGAQPEKAFEYVADEMKRWQELGVEGHLEGSSPWISYHKLLTEEMAHLIGASPSEVAVMNSLTVNLHLMLVSFYRPTAKRHKILINPHIFSSDFYALRSHVEFHGYDPDDSILMLPANSKGIVNQESIEELLEGKGDEIALVFMESVNYYTGQAFDVNAIAAKAKLQGCFVGFDLAHGIGNCQYDLGQGNVDFAVWCSYKYLNGGPGGIGGCFIHRNHHKENTMPRFTGWWGHDFEGRFYRDKKFHPMPGAEGWQLSNPPILSIACLKASLEIFNEAGMLALREKSKKLTGYLEFLLESLPIKNFEIITPRDQEERGCQLSIRVQGEGKILLERLKKGGFICDLRYPDVIRLAPVPLYNTFEEVFHFYDFLKNKTGEC